MTPPGGQAPPVACAARLGLGTVQFGMRYGVAHGGPQPSREDAIAAMESAASLGVETLDTAPRYGTAEEVIGALEGRADLRLVTKTDADEPGWSAGASLVRGAERSLARLGVERVHGFLEHDAAQLLGPDGDERWRALETVRDWGHADRIGVSVYDPEDVFALVERYPVEIVQVPLNVLDRRMLDSGALAHLDASGVEVHVRSALLQGALAAAPRDLAGNPALAAAVAAFQRECAAAEVAPLDAALGFVLDGAPRATVVVGAQDAAQLRGVVEAGDRGLASAGRVRCDASPDPEVFDPRRWGAHA